MHAPAPMAAGVAPLVGELADAVWIPIHQSSTRDLTCIEASVSDELAHAFERDVEGIRALKLGGKSSRLFSAVVSRSVRRYLPAGTCP